MTNDEILQAAKDAGLLHPDAKAASRIVFDFATIIEKRTIERCANECNKNLIDQITYAEHAAIKKQRDELLKAIALAMPVMDAHAGPSRLADFRAAIASVKGEQ